MTRTAKPSRFAFPSAADEDAFLRAYARRCRGLDLVGSGALMVMLMILAIPEEGFWLVAPHGVSLALLVYSTARWLRSECHGWHDGGSPDPAPGGPPARQPERDEGAASSSTAGAAGPSSGAQQAGGNHKQGAGGSASAGGSRLRQLLHTLLDDGSRHYVMTGILVLQPLVLLVGGPCWSGLGLHWWGKGLPAHGAARSPAWLQQAGRPRALSRRPDTRRRCRRRRIAGAAAAGAHGAGRRAQRAAPRRGAAGGGRAAAAQGGLPAGAAAPELLRAGGRAGLRCASAACQCCVPVGGRAAPGCLSVGARGRRALAEPPSDC
jgi:hypothetical protein